MGKVFRKSKEGEWCLTPQAEKLDSLAEAYQKEIACDKDREIDFLKQQVANLFKMVMGPQ